jgi:predicted nucleic acid-binding protein
VASTVLATRDLSLWDALIVEAARAADCDGLLTEDLNADQDFGGVRVENPLVPNDR